MLKSGHDRALRQAQGLERSRNGVALHTEKTRLFEHGGTRPAQRGTSSVYHAFRVVASVFFSTVSHGRVAQIEIPRLRSE